jgi:hypothetical protein
VIKRSLASWAGKAMDERMTLAGFITNESAHYGAPNTASCRAPGVRQSRCCRWSDTDASLVCARPRCTRPTANMKRAFAPHRDIHGSPYVTDLHKRGCRAGDNPVAQAIHRLAWSHVPPTIGRLQRARTQAGGGR